jgi:hypothetical protein
MLGPGCCGQVVSAGQSVRPGDSVLVHYREHGEAPPFDKERPPMPRAIPRDPIYRGRRFSVDVIEPCVR